MTNMRQTIIWAIFIFSAIMLWDQWQIHNGKKPLFFHPQESAVEQVNTAQIKPADVDVPDSSGLATGGVIPSSTPEITAGSSIKGENIVVTTDQYRVTFNTVGATIVELDLLKHFDQNDKSLPIKLINPIYNYQVRTGVINAQGGALPTHNTVMHLVSPQKSMQDGQDTLVVRFESEAVNGVKEVKTYTFTRDQFVIDITTDIINNSDVAITPEVYYQLVRNGDAIPGASRWFGGNTFTGPAYYNDDKRYKKFAFKEFEEKAPVKIDDDNGWVAMVQHYFVSAWLLDDGIQRQIFTKKLENNNYAIGLISPLKTLEPGESVSQSIKLFSGPQHEKVLEKLAPGLELVKDYGMFRILSRPLFWLLHFLNQFLGNWGWSIVALVVLLKAAFFWLNARAYQSMAKMRALSPRLQEINERYKDEPQQKQQETMRIYKEEKINPLGGCLPILVQIPVFIALYWVLLSSVEMRNAPWIGWITDLSAKDPYFILPAVMAASTVLQTWLNPKPADPMQAKMMWLMPMMFSVMFFMFPAGLVLYWVTNNLLSIAQQWFINNKLVKKTA